MILEKKVAYLSRETAAEYHQHLKSLGIPGRSTTCVAKVHRWMSDEEDADDFGDWRYCVTLGLAWPPAIYIPGEPEYLLEPTKDGRRQKLR